MTKSKLGKLSAWIPRLLLVNILTLGVLHVVTTVASLEYPASSLASVAFWFDLDQEYNLPTYYSGLVLGSIAFCAWKLRKKARLPSRKYFWIFLSALFAYWALDEVLVIHEQTAEPLRNLFSIANESLYYHAWVMLALPLVALLGGVLLFIYHLKNRPITKQQLGLISLIFFFMTGVIVLEVLGTQVYSNVYVYRLVAVPAEELFEIGMASFILVKLLKLYGSKK